ncbi:MAG: Holliday junction branch migration protein RuvA [Desulfovibrionaceae bacterium]
MIAYIEGRLLEQSEDACVVLTPGGVGYELYLTGPLLARLPARGEEVQYYVADVVREDAYDLYGFGTWDERETFLTLISISKLGPKTGVALLSHFTPDELRRVVANEDPLALTVVSGIGKKTAQHIFLELKYKLKAGGVPGAATPASLGAGVFRDALAGLVNLGYAEDEVRPVLEKLLQAEPDLDVSGALRAALKEMAKAR